MTSFSPLPHCLPTPAASPPDHITPLLAPSLTLPWRKRAWKPAEPVHTCSSSFFFFPVPGEEERGKPPPSLAWGSVHMTFEVGLPLHLGSIVYSLKQPVFLLIADIICKCPLPSSSVLPMPPSPPFHHPSIFSWPSCSPPPPALHSAKVIFCLLSLSPSFP